jgi:putative tryptophan/tyrosine transport system substrate-binding protein
MSIRRRDFIKGIAGSAAVWPLSAHAQTSRLSVVGLLSSRTAGDSLHLEAALRGGLCEAGYVDGRDIQIVHRQSDERSDRLPAMTAALLEEGAGVIVAVDREAVFAAKAATTATPIVFVVGDYPIRHPLFFGRDRSSSDIYEPRSNVTGISLYGYECERQLFALLSEMVPKRARITLRRDGAPILADMNPSNAAAWLHEEYPVILNAQRPPDLSRITIGRLGLRVYFSVPPRRSVSDDRIVNLPEHILTHAKRFTAMLERHGWVIDNWRAPIDAGSMDYGPGYTDACRHAGLYVGRILDGARPADLPPLLGSCGSELVISFRKFGVVA